MCMWGAHLRVMQWRELLPWWLLLYWFWCVKCLQDYLTTTVKWSEASHQSQVDYSFLRYLLYSWDSGCHPCWEGKWAVITGSPAGLSRVNGDRRSSAITWNFSHLPKPHLWINWFEIWIEWLRHAFQKPCQVRCISFQRWRPHVVVKNAGRVPFIIIFIFFYSLARIPDFNAQ